MPKISTLLPSAGKGEAQRLRARQRRLEQMESWEGVPEKGSRWIPLGKEKMAIVDEGYYDHLMQWNWHISALGYAIRFFRQNGKPKVIWMHREILKTRTGMQTDHINRNRLDNRKSNLRECSPTQNQGNRWKSKQAKTSKFKGVYWSKAQNRFAAYGREGEKNKRLGSFRSEIEAAKAYNRWAADYFGKFAQLNPV
jgi:hypothetical protein